MTITRADSDSPAASGNFRRNKSGARYTSSSIRKSHLSPARSSFGASLPSNLSVCWYDNLESLSMSVSSVLFFVELESTWDIVEPFFFNTVGLTKCNKVAVFMRASRPASAYKHRRLLSALACSHDNEFPFANVYRSQVLRSMATIQPGSLHP